MTSDDIGWYRLTVQLLRPDAVAGSEDRPECRESRDRPTLLTGGGGSRYTDPVDAKRIRFDTFDPRWKFSLSREPIGKIYLSFFFHISWMWKRS